MPLPLAQSLCECGVGDSHGTEAVAVDPDARAAPRLGVGLAGSSAEGNVGDQGEAERSQHLDHAEPAVDTSEQQHVIRVPYRACV